MVAKVILFFYLFKAVVGGMAGPAIAGPLFLPEMVLAGPHFWPNTFFAGLFSHVSSRPSLMIYFSMIKDELLNDLTEACAGHYFGCLRV